jgi:hypothetical protein
VLVRGVQPLSGTMPSQAFARKTAWLAFAGILSVVTLRVRSPKLWQDILCGCRGKNYDGFVGDGTTIDRLMPVKVGPSETWLAISAGSYQSCGIKESDDSAWCWVSRAAWYHCLCSYTWLHLALLVGTINHVNYYYY